MNLSTHGVTTGRISSNQAALLSVPALKALVRHEGKLYEVVKGEDDLLSAARNGSLKGLADMQGLCVVSTYYTVHSAGYPPSFKPLLSEVLEQLSRALDDRPTLREQVVAFEMVPDTMSLNRVHGTTEYCHHVQVLLYGRP